LITESNELTVIRQLCSLFVNPTMFAYSKSAPHTSWPSSWELPIWFDNLFWWNSVVFVPLSS